MTPFFDAAEWRNIPARANAAVYGDGLFVAPAAQVYARFAKVRWITVWGGTAAAKYAGCADFEQGNSVFDPARLRAWAEGRDAMNCLARVYTDESNLPAAFDAVGHMDNIRWWIALYQEPARTAEELAAAVAHRAPIAPDRIWGQQYAGAPNDAYDKDVLLGQW